MDSRGPTLASDPGAAATGWRSVGIRLRALRAFSLPPTLLPILIATAMVRPVEAWDWPILVASLVGAAMLGLTGNLLNDVFDFRSGVDRKVEGDEGRPGRFLVRGELTAREVLAFAAACALAAAAARAYLLWRRPRLAWFGATALFGLYAYTGPPFRLKYRSLGELTIFLVFGPALTLGAAFAQIGRLDWHVGVLSIPIGMVTTAIAVAGNVRDRQEDGQAHIRTLAHIGSGGLARAAYIALPMAAVASLVVMAAVGQAPKLFLATPALLVLLLKPIAWVWRNRRLVDIDVRTARFGAALMLLMLAAMLLD